MLPVLKATDRLTDFLFKTVRKKKHFGVTDNTKEATDTQKLKKLNWIEIWVYQILLIGLRYG